MWRTVREASVLKTRNSTLLIIQISRWWSRYDIFDFLVPCHNFVMHYGISKRSWQYPRKLEMQILRKFSEAIKGIQRSTIEQLRKASIVAHNFFLFFMNYCEFFFWSPGKILIMNLFCTHLCVLLQKYSNITYFLYVLSINCIIHLL